jgi:hypothetical protein
MQDCKPRQHNTAGSNASWVCVRTNYVLQRMATTIGLLCPFWGSKDTQLICTRPSFPTRWLVECALRCRMAQGQDLTGKREMRGSEDAF